LERLKNFAVQYPLGATEEFCPQIIAPSRVFYDFVGAGGGFLANFVCDCTRGATSNTLWKGQVEDT
jgi:hypothetical protein